MDGYGIRDCGILEGAVLRRNGGIRRMLLLSMGVHIVVFALGSAIAPLFPDRAFSPPVMVELTDAPPMSELPEEEPAPPAPSRTAAMAPASQGPAAAASRAPAPAPSAAKTAGKWLQKLDAGLPAVPEAPVARGEGKAGGIPVRNWSNEGPVKPGDFAPAVAPERTAALGKHLEELEGRVLRAGRSSVVSGKETEASMMFGGTGESPGEPIPAWVREMIRKRVRGYLPELEALYTDAIRRNPDLRGKMLVRFRIDPSGRILEAGPAEERFGDPAFVNAVLGKVRRWTFEPTGGRAVEVLYPFVFVAPS